ncbi:MAG: universal stress protein [Desulfuromonadaceae bacterium]|nr:universal stress protein [Desulfuromonadaceae bacterium]
MLPKIDTILLATALGGGASHVLCYALSLARQYRAKLEVVYGLEPLKPYAQHVAGTYIDEKKLDDYHQQSKIKIRQELVAMVTELYGSDLAKADDEYHPPFNVSVLDAVPDQAILAHAKAVSADLIVMGTHERMAQKGALMGSCAFKVLHQASIPVLMVRIPEELSGFRRNPDKPAIMD